MNEQVIETVETELNLQDLEQVQGGLTCRKAGGNQTEAVPVSGSIIAI